MCDSVDIHGSLRGCACVRVGLCCIRPFLLVPASASLHVCLYECHCADIEMCTSVWGNGNSGVGEGDGDIWE